MSGGNLAKFHLGALDRVRDRALGMLGSGSPRSLAHHAFAPLRLSLVFGSAKWFRSLVSEINRVYG